MSEDAIRHLDRFALLEQFMSLTTEVGLSAMALIRLKEYDRAEALQKSFQPICDWFNAGFRASMEKQQ